MATATQSFTCRLSPEAVEALRRQSAISNWSMAQLIESFALGLQDSWYARFTASERARYEQKIMGRVEAISIRRRAGMKTGDGADARAGQLPAPTIGHDPQLSGDAANTNVDSSSAKDVA